MISVDIIKSIATKLPHVTEDVKWGADLCFCIAGKMFCVTGLEGEAGVSLKVTDEEFIELIEREGIIPAPYMARNKWVLIEKNAKVNRKELEQLITQSYHLIKSRLSKKLQQ